MALSVTLPDNGSPVPVEFRSGFEDLEEPGDSIPDSGPEPAPHRMPHAHVVGPSPAGPPRAAEAALASPGMPLDARGVGYQAAPASPGMSSDAHGVGHRPPAPASELEASIPGSALHRMPHVAGPPPTGPPPLPRATEVAAGPSGMLDTRVVGYRRPAESGPTRARKASKLAVTHTFSMQQHVFLAQQPMQIVMPPKTPIPAAPPGYRDWLKFYQDHKLQVIAAAQLERVSQLSLVNEGEYANEDC